MRTAYDACTWSNLPNEAIGLAYVDGSCAVNLDVVRRAKPNALIAGISAVGTNAGTILDCEPGNLNAVQSVNWVLMRRQAGADPTVYVAQWAPGYTWSDVLNAHAAKGVPAPHIWVAPWSASVPSGAVAAQYAYKGTYDVSVCLDYWPGVDPAPPTPEVLKESMNIKTFRSNAQASVVAANAEGFVYVVWRDTKGSWHTAAGGYGPDSMAIGQIDTNLGLDVDDANPFELLVYGYWADKLYCIYSNADWSKWTPIVV